MCINLRESIVGNNPPIVNNQPVLQENNNLGNTVAQGLKSIFLAKKNNELQLNQAGLRFQPARDQQPVTHGPYRIVGDKSKGVEPGFIAKKDWNESDNQKLLDPNHKFNKTAKELIQKWDAEEIEPPQDFKELAQQIREENNGELSLEMLLENDHIKEAIKQHLMATEVKFDKNHYVKLDYYEDDKFNGKYQIPKDKAKNILSVGFLEKIGKWLHRLFTGETPTKRNEGAVREVMANDLMRELGIQSQKLKLVPTQYEDGTQKLLLDGTHIENFKDFDGRPDRGERYLKDGFLVKNDESGDPQLDTSMEKLGRNKILMLLLSDRDALGSTGGNKGYVGDQFFGIDPGHALEKNLLNKQDDVFSDFSFKQPSSIKSKGYKNFSMFDQTPLSEKMEGVRQIKQLKESGKDREIFEEYAQQFDGKPLVGQNDDTICPELNFKEAIQEMQVGFENRRDYILGVFEERLQVDDFNFGLDKQSPEHREKVDQSLNLLDGLEKLTSKTTGQTKSGITLEIPQVEKPKDRAEWHIQQKENGDIEFQFRGSKSQVRDIKNKIEAFKNSSEGSPELNLEDGKAHGPGYSRTLTLTVPLDQIDQVANLFDYPKIMQFKHPD